MYTGDFLEYELKEWLVFNIPQTLSFETYFIIIKKKDKIKLCIFHKIII